MANTVSIQGLEHRPKLKKSVAAIAQAVLGYFRLQSKHLEIIFLGNKEMVTLKRRYIKKTGPANTLSFGAGEAFPGEGRKQKSLGEVFVNTELTNYELEKISPLVVHSILHLLGYHHDRERDKIEMDRLALRVSKALKK